MTSAAVSSSLMRIILQRLFTSRFVMILGREGEPNGKADRHCEAVEEGTRPRRAAVVRIECSTLRLCRCVHRSQTNRQETNDFSSGPQENCSRATGQVGQGES